MITNWFHKKTDKIDLKKLSPYGDRLGDGAMQLSFTLPVENSATAKEAARQYVEKLGFGDVHVATAEAMGAGFTFFVVFGHCKKTIDFSKVKVAKVAYEKMDYDQLMKFANEHIEKRLVVLGATTGFDAHTVGLDAILNMKGYMGDPGLERYPFFQVINLRSQVSNAELIQKAIQHRADVLLVSKLVTQRNQHITDLKELMKLLKQNKELSNSLLKIIGGPKITHAEATKLGYDAGFGPGTMPSEVAGFILQEFVKRK